MGSTGVMNTYVAADGWSKAISKIDYINIKAEDNIFIKDAVVADKGVGPMLKAA